MKTVRHRLITPIVKLAGLSARTPVSTAAGLTRCGKRPNCVSSRAPPGSRHYVAPLRHGATRAEAQQALLEIIGNHGNARLVTEEAGFIHAAFASKLGFVDDVMFLLHADDGVVDVKSAARVGHYDFNVNRRRVEALRGEFGAVLARS